MKIKILQVFEQQYYNDDYEQSLYTLNQTSDWDDVSNELTKVKDDVTKQPNETTAPKNSQNNN